MTKLINNKTLTIRGGYISESEVLDEDTNKTYYVVVRLGDLLYATFDGSLIAYLQGKANEPNKIEGETHLWYNTFEDRDETPFWKYYEDCYAKANDLKFKQEVVRKHAHLKKPLGNIKYETVYRKSKSVYSCGPMGEAYEIKFHILDDDTYLYVNANDWGCYMLTTYSYLDAKDDQDLNEGLIDVFEGFEKAKKSKYYDLFLEMERYIDGIC